MSHCAKEKKPCSWSGAQSRAETSVRLWHFSHSWGELSVVRPSWLKWSERFDFIWGSICQWVSEGKKSFRFSCSIITRLHSALQASETNYSTFLLVLQGLQPFITALLLWKWLFRAVCPSRRFWQILWQVRWLSWGSSSEYVRGDRRECTER